MSQTFKLTIAYDGTDFIGWQRQASGVSIQGLLEDALGELDGRPVTVIGAGRTDAGVHARGQVAAARLEREIDAATVVRAVNIRLPPSVRMLDASPVPGDFHARFDARLKSYRYRIWNADVMSPFERSYAWHVPMALDVAAMAAAAAALRGTHDFAAFQGTRQRYANDRSDHGSVGRRTRRRLTARRLRRRWRRVSCGTWFGTSSARCVEVGRGRYPAAWIGEVLASRDRTSAGPTAPAHGLFLMAVAYDEVEKVSGDPLRVARVK